MTALTISPTLRKSLKADAHDLKPVVMVGGDGLTPAVIKEARHAISHHQLIKVRVFGDDRDERIAIGRKHRLPLLSIGVITGFMGALPSMVWASGALFAAAFVVLVPVAIWVYSLVFAFTALWFTHYSLGALENMRAEANPVVVGASVPVPALALADESSNNPPTP